jgi:hypothetical protein
MFDVNTFMQRELAALAVPSKRSVKNKSGRASRKQLRSAAVLQAVGGFSSTTSAVFAAPDHKMCRVVETAKVGWKPDGTPRREPRVGRQFGA